MKIYLCHSTSFDFQNELYLPLKNASFWQQHVWFLPHIMSLEPSYSKEIIEDCDCVIAEVSYPSTGMGIELGWANLLQREIVCLYKAGTKISSSISLISQKLISYNNIDDMLIKVSHQLEKSI